MKVCELFKDESDWTQGSYQRYKNANYNDNSVCYCLVGAILTCYPMGSASEIFGKVKNKISKSDDTFANDYAGTGPIILWNDSSKRTFKEVKDLVCELGI